MYNYNKNLFIIYTIYNNLQHNIILIKNIVKRDKLDFNLLTKI